MNHHLMMARADDHGTEIGIGREFDDSREGLRGLANAAIGMNGRVPEGLRLVVKNREPWTGEDSAPADDTDAPWRFAGIH